MKVHSTIKTAMTASLPERITADMRQKIATGHWLAGTMVPTRRQLASSYGVALRTIELAIAPLVREGVLVALGPKGTYIAPVGGTAPSMAALPGIARGNRDKMIRSTSGRGTQTVIGIVGAWTGHATDYCLNNAVAQALEVAASDRPQVTLRYFNRFVDYEVQRLGLIHASRALIEQGAHCLAILPVSDDDNVQATALIDIAAEHDVSLVFVDVFVESRRACLITYDSEHAGYRAAEHLYSRGWDHLVYFDVVDAFWSRERVVGARNACNQLARGSQSFEVFDADGDIRLDHTHEGHQEHGLTTGRKFFAKSHRPCGIIAPNDYLANGILMAAEEAGLRMGEDFGIVGFDDVQQSRIKGLTSLRPPASAMGAQALHQLMLAERGSKLPFRISLESELIARGSSLRPTLHQAPARSEKTAALVS